MTISRDKSKYAVFLRAYCMDEMTRVSGEVMYVSPIQAKETRLVSWPSCGPVGIEFARDFARTILAICDAVEKEPRQK